MKTVSGGKSNIGRGLWGVMEILLLVGMSLLTGCAGGANLGAMGGSRFDSGPTPDSSADFSQLPSGGFGGSESPGVVATASASDTTSFGSPVFAGDTGFDSHGFGADGFGSGSFASTTGSAPAPVKLSEGVVPERPACALAGLLPAGSPVVNSSVSGLVLGQFLQALSYIK